MEFQNVLLEQNLKYVSGGKISPHGAGKYGGYAVLVIATAYTADSIISDIYNLRLWNATLKTAGLVGLTIVGCAAFSKEDSTPVTSSKNGVIDIVANLVSKFEDNPGDKESWTVSIDTYKGNETLNNFTAGMDNSIRNVAAKGTSLTNFFVGATIRNLGDCLKKSPPLEFQIPVIGGKCTINSSEQ